MFVSHPLPTNATLVNVIYYYYFLMWNQRGCKSSCKAHCYCTWSWERFFWQARNARRAYCNLALVTLWRSDTDFLFLLLLAQRCMLAIELIEQSTLCIRPDFWPCKRNIWSWSSYRLWFNHTIGDRWEPWSPSKNSIVREDAV